MTQLQKIILATLVISGLIVVATVLAIGSTSHQGVPAERLQTGKGAQRAKPGADGDAMRTSGVGDGSLDEIPASVTVYPEREPERKVDQALNRNGLGDDGLQETLQRWSAAMVKNDPYAEAAEYAAHMDKYFLKNNVDHAFVEADKRDFLRRGNSTADFTIRDVVIESQTDVTADVRLVKDVTWQRAGVSTHRLIRSRLHLQKFLDGWKITGEQDFK